MGKCRKRKLASKLLKAFGLAGVILCGALYLLYLVSPLRMRISELDNEEAYVRGLAAYRLGKMGPKAAAAIPELVALLDDVTEITPPNEPYQGPGVRHRILEFFGLGYEEYECYMPTWDGGATPGDRARKALIKIGRPSVPALLQRLRKAASHGASAHGPREGWRDPGRANAALALAGIRDPRAIPVLAEAALHTDDPDFSACAVRSLGSFGIRAFEPLLRCFRKGSVLGGPAWSELNGMSGIPLETLLGLLKDDDPNARCLAIDLLMNLGDPNDVAPVGRVAVEDNCESARLRALQLLRGRRTSDILGPVGQAVREEKSRRLRLKAIAVLGDRRDARVVPLLCHAWIADSWDVNRIRAHTCLRELRKEGIAKPKAVAEHLVGLLGHEDPAARERAIDALGELEENITIDPLIRMLSDESSVVRSSAAVNLGFFRDRRAVNPLIQALRDKSPAVRRSAIRALERIGDPRAAVHLIHALHERDEDGFPVAEAGVAHLADERAIDALLRAAADQDREVRRVAVETLAKLHDPRVTEALVNAALDPREYVCMSACLAIRRGRNAEAVDRLISRLGGSDEDVRSRAGLALTKILCEKFGADLRKWRAWWSGRRATFGRQATDGEH